MFWLLEGNMTICQQAIPRKSYSYLNRLTDEYKSNNARPVLITRVKTAH